ncbi:helix-turn-helix domain-containing protein [Streptomyces longwoodensis]|uniref:helix-turn-helix domain-containing protein n=1 Tax=Streptomyces longwoodensis TaxID=68231 RepID=UPI00381F6BCB
MAAVHDDVAEFALQLRRLKERTDRSYAALARRLDMHASTLHRYCAGEAVPQEFAGVERFAVLCGASVEERTELHRRWVVADAARRRPRPQEGRGAAVPPGGDTGPVAVADLARPVPSAVPDSARPVSAAVPDLARSAPDRRPRVRFRPRHRSRPRRSPVRSVALALSLVAALPWLTASTAGHPPAPTAHPAPGKGPAPQGAGAAIPAPLTWTADDHTLGLTSCGEDYVVAQPPQNVPPPPHPEDIAAWATSQRAVHAGTTGVRITVQGRGSAAVVLQALHVRVAHRTTPAPDRGTVYSLSDGCGAGITPRFFSVDLDAYQPVARSMPGDDGAGTPVPAIGFPYRVSLQDPEVLMVSARTESCTCDWYLDLTWSSQGRTGTVRIDDHGRPFHSTSSTGLPGYRYARVSHRPGRWVPIPAANLDATAD